MGRKTKQKKNAKKVNRYTKSSANLLKKNPYYGAIRAKRKIKSDSMKKQLRKKYLDDIYLTNET